MDIPLKAYFEILEAGVTSLGLIIGGIWIYFKFISTCENHPKIQFDLDVGIIGRQDKKILIELIAIINNKGLVRHWVNDFICDVLILQKDDPIETGAQKINYQVKFKKFNPVKDKNICNEKYLDRIIWVPENWYNAFIDPGVEQKFTYITAIPEDTTFISLYSRFITKNDFLNSAQRTFSVSKLESNE